MAENTARDGREHSQRWQRTQPEMAENTARDGREHSQRWQRTQPEMAEMAENTARDRTKWRLKLLSGLMHQLGCEEDK